jgi:hypothetical protein
MPNTITAPHQLPSDAGAGSSDLRAAQAAPIGADFFIVGQKKTVLVKVVELE